MSDYIKREDALRWYPDPKSEREYLTGNLDDAYESGYDNKVRQIENLPAADVRENKRGKWILANKGYLPMVFACSVCGGKHKDAGDEFFFCPFCGAVMDDDWEYS